MNKIFLIGRITKELELRSTKSGKSVCEFTIAVNRDKENADFINCVVWNEQAENLVKYQNKGSLISVMGELRNETYDKPDGTRGYKTYVLVNVIEYLSKSEQKVETQEKRDKEKIQDPFEEFGDEINDNFLD